MSTDNTTIPVSKQFHRELRSKVPKGTTYEAWLRERLSDDLTGGGD